MSLSIAERWSNRSWLIQHAFSLALCILLSLIVVATASTLVLQAGFLDPYVYAGYVHDYFGTFQRYGHTYYSSRIAYIFLDKTFISIFGETTGLLLCRILILSCSAYAAFCIAKRYFGWGPAIIAISWICLIPWLLRSIAWTHYDGFATAYLLFALTFLLVPRDRRLIAHAAAGFFLALAVNCNLHLLMVAGLFAPSWLWFNRRVRLADLAFLILSIATGFIVGYAILQLLFSLAIGNFRVFIEAAALNSARSLLGGELANWFHPFSKLIAGGMFIFLMPIFFTLAGVIGLIVNRRHLSTEKGDFFVASSFYCAAVFVGALVLHTFFKHTWFSVFYYDVYFVPACLLVLISLAGMTFDALSKKAAWFLASTSLLSLLALWFSRETMDITLSVDIRPWMYFSVVVLLCALVYPKITAAPVLLVGLICATYGMFQMQAGVVQQYALWAGKDMRGEADVYRGAVFLQSFVRRHVPNTAPVGFWYSNDPKNVNLNSMQAMFLWAYSRLQNHTGPGMPTVDEYFRQQIRSRDYIAIMARNDQEIDAAYSALRELPTRYHEVGRSVYNSPTERYIVALAEIHAVPAQLGQELREIPVQELQVQNGARLLSTSTGIELTTASCLWCYSAVSPPATSSSDGSDVILRMNITLGSGQIGVATVTSSNMNELSGLTPIIPRVGKQTIDIRIKSPKANEIVVFRNESPNGASRMTIHSLGYYAPN